VEARTELAPTLTGNKDLLFLDVALENGIRGAAERGVGSAGACCVCVWGGGDGGGGMTWVPHDGCVHVIIIWDSV
jgi:hypothetical protein